MAETDLSYEANYKFQRDRADALQRLICAILLKHGPITIDPVTFNSLPRTAEMETQKNQQTGEYTFSFHRP